MNTSTTIVAVSGIDAVHALLVGGTAGIAPTGGTSMAGVAATPRVYRARDQRTPSVHPTTSPHRLV